MPQIHRRIAVVVYLPIRSLTHGHRLTTPLQLLLPVDLENLSHHYLLDILERLSVLFLVPPTRIRIVLYHLIHRFELQEFALETIDPYVSRQSLVTN